MLNVSCSQVERDLLEDGYHGDVIGEVTPDFVFENVVSETESSPLILLYISNLILHIRYTCNCGFYRYVRFAIRIDIFILQMKGERKMLERLLQTEIAMLRAIRDGSALMQHMEDFYYIALLEVGPSLSLSLICF